MKKVVVLFLVVFILIVSQTVFIAAEEAQLEIVGATASSYYEGELGTYIPGNAIDGNADTFWQGHEGSSFATDPKWLQLDFGKSVEVKKVSIFFYSAAHVASKFEMRVSDNEDGSDYEVIYTVENNLEHDLSYNISESKQGRYLRLYFTEGVQDSWWVPTVNTVTVFGTSETQSSEPPLSETPSDAGLFIYILSAIGAGSLIVKRNGFKVK